MTDIDQSLPYDDHAPLLGDVVADPLEAMKASIPEHRGNLIYREIELHSGPYVRTVARFCQVYRHATHEYRHTSVELVHFKRPNQHAAFTVDRKFGLDGAALEALVAAAQAIPRLQTIGEAAGSLVVPMTRSPHDVAPDDFNTIVSGLSALLNSEHGFRAIAEGKLTTEALINIDAAAQQARYRGAAAELRAMMDEPNRDEQEYQTWFELHPWVFGTEYLRRIPARQIDIESKVDIVLLSADGYVDVFELKKPSETVLAGPSRHTYYAAAPVSQALSQAMHYLRLMNENRLRLEEAWGKLVFRPRAIVVIGRSNAWDEDQKQAWRNLRMSLQNIDLLTYDHVLARANWLVAQYTLPAAKVADTT
jgi:Domain of unknown function (DUF4263)